MKITLEIEDKYVDMFDEPYFHITIEDFILNALKKGYADMKEDEELELMYQSMLPSCEIPIKDELPF